MPTAFIRRFQENQAKSPESQKPKRKPWGWGQSGDEPDPFSKLGRRIYKDVSETVHDARDEPEELLYRIRERLKSYAPGARQ